MTLKYALTPSPYCAYLPPIGFVFEVMTATRISFLESSTPFSLLGTNLERSACDAVVCGEPLPVDGDCDFPPEFELPHAAATSANRTPVARRCRARMKVPPDTGLG